MRPAEERLQVRDRANTHTCWAFIWVMEPSCGCDPIAEVTASMRAVMPSSLASVHKHRLHNLATIRSYSKAWHCPIPQMGPGRKCDRKIELADWQQAIAAEDIASSSAGA